MLGVLGRRQGAGAGSLYVAGAFAVSGVLTYVFHGLAARVLGPEGYGGLGVLWAATFLAVQTIWPGFTQTLGRYVAEREARDEDWRPVVLSVKRLQLTLLGVFLLVALPASPLLAKGVFGGDWTLTLAFVAAVAAYAPEYFRRGTFGGHRRFARLGALHVAESSSRALISGVLLVAGAGVAGPAAAIVLAPLVGVLLVREVPGEPPEREGEPFSAVEGIRFAGPVLLCVAFAQALMNGGPILVSTLGGPDAQERAGILLAALILARVPQYVLSPAIAGLLPHASRVLAAEGRRGLDRFVGKAAGAVGLAGAATVAGVWLFGERAMSLFYGPGFGAGREALVLLATLAAFYLLSETLNQALFSLGRARLAVLGWLVGLLTAAVCAATLPGAGTLDGISLSLALGAVATTASQTAFYLAARRRVPGVDGPR